MSRAVYQRRTVTCLATLTESDCTVVLQQKCDNATLIIFISTTTTIPRRLRRLDLNHSHSEICLRYWIRDLIRFRIVAADSNRTEISDSQVFT